MSAIVDILSGEECFADQASRLEALVENLGAELGAIRPADQPFEDDHKLRLASAWGSGEEQYLLR